MFEDKSLLQDGLQALNFFPLSLEQGLKISSLLDKMCPFGWGSFNINKFEKKSDEFKSKYPIVMWGKVDWSRFDKKIEVGDRLQDIIPALEQFLGKNFDREVYIEWDTCAPIIRTNLDNLIQHFNVIDYISSYKFVFNPMVGYIIEISSSFPIMVGMFPTSDKFFKKEAYVDPEILKHDIVFKECVEALKIDLLTVEEEKSLDTWFRNHVPMTKWGRVDWDKFDKKSSIRSSLKNMKRDLSKVLQARGPFDTTVFIEWGEIGIPVIRTTLGDVIGNFKDIEYVAFEKFLFNPSFGYVIEILNDGRVTIGIIPNFFLKKDVTGAIST